jgi:2-oxoglutarate dehydrogenase E2 component (dihydrolipoamide succinyltransferase)
MPALGESVTEGTVTQWLKQVGDAVAVDEPIVEISTDKVDTEIPSPFAGVLLEILIPEDGVAEVGAVLAVLGEPGESTAASASPPAPDAVPHAPADPPAEPAARPAPTTAPTPFAVPAPTADRPTPTPDRAPAPAPAPVVAAPVPPPHVRPPEARGTASAKAYVTPLIRKLAGDVGVDLDAVTGTGVGGRIRREDVLAAAAPPPAPPAPAPAPAGADERLPRLRAMTADRELREALQPPQLTSVAEVDVTEVTRLVERGQRRFMEREGVTLERDPFFALATVEALKANPVFNAAIVDGDVVYYGQENLGVTVFTPSGPLAPVIPDAGSLGLVGLARAIAGVQARAAGGALLPTDLAAGTFTITAPAGPDLMLDFPVIEPPQVAVLSIGAVTRRPVVMGEGIAVRSTSYLALSYDSRLVTPSDAAKFLGAVKARLETGAFEAELAL